MSKQNPRPPKPKIGTFIDPLTDFGFKFLLGSEPTKELLIGSLKEVYFIGIMDSVLEDSAPAEYIHYVRLNYEKTGREFYKKLGLIFIEIPKPARPVRRVYKDRKGIKNGCR